MKVIECILIVEETDKSVDEHSDIKSKSSECENCASNAVYDLKDPSDNPSEEDLPTTK